MGCIEVFDIETDITETTASVIHCIAIKELESVCSPELYYDAGHGASTPKRGTVADGLRRLNRGSGLIAHNGVMFDLPTIYSLSRAYGVEPRIRDGWEIFDTLLCSRLLYSESTTLPSYERRLQASAGPHSLEAWGYHFGRAKVVHEDWSALSNDMLHRCSEDVEITIMLAKYLQLKAAGYGPSVLLEHDVANIISRQIWGGIQLDVASLERLAVALSCGYDENLRKLRGAFPPTIQTMRRPASYTYESSLHSFTGLTKGAVQAEIRAAKLRPLKTHFHQIKPGPPERREIPFEATGDKFAAALIEHRDWKPEVFTATGKPAMNKDIYPTLSFEEALWYMECTKCKNLSGDMISGKKSVLLNKRDTGRIHPSIITNGCYTGRMSHSYHIAQISRVKKRDGEMLYGLEGNFGADCRQCFTARPGWWMVGADAAGLEMRMLASFLAPYDGGALIRIILEGDIHDYMMERLETPTRDSTKTAEYLLIYGGGDPLLGTRIKACGSLTDDMRMNLRNRDPRALGAKIRKNLMTNVTGMQQLLDALKHQARQNNNYIFLNDGRPVIIRKEHAILNTLLQGNGAIMMKHALRLVWAKLQERGAPFIHDEPWRGIEGNWQMLMNTHDEFQAECFDRDGADIIGNVMVNAMIASGQHLNYACPMDGEYTLGKNWAETH